MTDILIDLTSRPRKRYSINMCNYCHDGNGKSTPKPILPSDRYARRTDKGDYKCGVCFGEETKKLLNMFGGRQKQ